MRECPYCAEDIEDNAVTCRWCGSELVPSADATTSGSPIPAGRGLAPPEARGGPIRSEQAAPQVKGSPPTRATVGERQATSVLKTVAWLELVLGVLGGVVVMAKALETPAYGDSFGYSSGGTNGALAVAGIGIIVYSVIIWAFLLVLASMATNLMVIRESTRR